VEKSWKNREKQFELGGFLMQHRKKPSLCQKYWMIFHEIMIKTTKNREYLPILHLNFIPGKHVFKLKSWKNRGKS